MIEQFRQVITQIDRNMVHDWVEDLVMAENLVGLRFQEAILKKVAGQLGERYRLSTPDDEARGIDGYINDVAISIKPTTYKSKRLTLSEQIRRSDNFYKRRGPD